MASTPAKAGHRTFSRMRGLYAALAIIALPYVSAPGRRPPLMRLPLRAVVLVLATAALTAPVHTQPAPRPNVVLIVTDDLGYGDIGSYGVRDAKTPSLDRLARQGVRFTDFYANAANCSPTRTGLITGRYQQRVGIEMPLGGTDRVEGRGLAPTGTSLPQLMRRRLCHGAREMAPRLESSSIKPARLRQFWGFLSGAHDSTSTAAAAFPISFTTPSRCQSGVLTDRSRCPLSFMTGMRRGVSPSRVQRAALAVQPPDLPEDRLARHAARRRGADYVGMVEAKSRIDRIWRGSTAPVDRPDLVIFTNDNGSEWLEQRAVFPPQVRCGGGLRVPAAFGGPVTCHLVRSPGKWASRWTSRPRSGGGRRRDACRLPARRSQPADVERAPGRSSARCSGGSPTRHVIEGRAPRRWKPARRCGLVDSVHEFCSTSTSTRRAPGPVANAAPMLAEFRAAGGIKADVARR